MFYLCTIPKDESAELNITAFRSLKAARAALNSTWATCAERCIIDTRDTPDAGYHDIGSIESRSDRAGFHFFDASAKRFFRSRIGDTVYFGRFFITSEQFEDSRGRRDSRRYSVRAINWHTGAVESVSAFQQFATSRQAAAWIKRNLGPVFGPVVNRSNAKHRKIYLQQSAAWAQAHAGN